MHGPLNLINMLDYWRDVHASDGTEAGEIQYRALSPLFAGERYCIRTGPDSPDERSKGTVEVLIARDDALCMKAVIKKHKGDRDPRMRMLPAIYLH